MLRVFELWRDLLPPSASILAGTAGLKSEVTWPVMLRTRPPAFGQLKGGEVALLSLQALRQLDPLLSLVQVVRQLHSARVSAIVVAGEAPAEALALANELGLALLGVPPETVLADVERSVSRAVVDRRADFQRRMRELERELMGLAIEGRGVAAILDRLAETLGRSAWLLAAKGPVVAERPATASGSSMAAAGARELLAPLGSRLGSARLAAADPPVVAVSAGGQAYLAAPVVRDGRACGFVALDGSGDPSTFERAAVARAAAACAVELARSQAVLAAQQDIEVEPLPALLDEVVPLERAAASATHHGIDLASPWAVCLVAAADGKDLDPQAAGALRAAVAAGSTWTWRDGKMCGLVPASAADATRLKATIEAALDGKSVRLGLGRSYAGVAGLRRSHREADWALRLGKLFDGAGAARAFASLGVHRVLCHPEQAPEIREFASSLLGDLRHHDAHHRSDLLRTLDVYLRTGGSPSETANRLGLHRNTVLYRLQRIVAITSLDLDDAERRLELSLALRAEEVRRACEGAGAQE